MAASLARILLVAAALLTQDDKGLLEDLRGYPHRLVREAKREGTFDLFLCDADGANEINLTRTPDVDELYPKASPDG